MKDKAVSLIAQLEGFKKKHKEEYCTCKLKDFHFGTTPYPEEGSCPFCFAIDQAITLVKKKTLELEAEIEKIPEHAKGFKGYSDVRLAYEMKKDVLKLIRGEKG